MYKFTALFALLTVTACATSSTDETATPSKDTPRAELGNKVDAQPAAYKTSSTDPDHACEGKKVKDKRAAVSPTKVTVPELAKLIADKTAVPVDVNDGKTRGKKGTIPGAILLSGYDYRVSELPADKDQKLVFYCANEHCAASKDAAKTAQNAGYKNVNVLPAGIFGWVEAGRAVTKNTSQI